MYERVCALSDLSYSSNLAQTLINECTHTRLAEVPKKSNDLGLYLKTSPYALPQNVILAPIRVPIQAISLNLTLTVSYSQNVALTLISAEMRGESVHPHTWGTELP